MALESVPAVMDLLVRQREWLPIEFLDATEYDVTGLDEANSVRGVDGSVNLAGPDVDALLLAAIVPLRLGELGVQWERVLTPAGIGEAGSVLGGLTVGPGRKLDILVRQLVDIESLWLHE